MIKAILEGCEGKTLLIGLSRNNTKLLLEGQPIKFSISDVIEHGLDPDDEIAIVGGETEESILEELSQYVPIDPSDVDDQRDPVH
jgi:hypothetical protein